MHASAIAYAFASGIRSGPLSLSPSLSWICMRDRGEILVRIEVLASYNVKDTCTTTLGTASAVLLPFSILQTLCLFYFLFSFSSASSSSSSSSFFFFFYLQNSGTSCGKRAHVPSSPLVRDFRTFHVEPLRLGTCFGNPAASRLVVCVFHRFARSRSREHVVVGESIRTPRPLKTFLRIYFEN